MAILRADELTLNLAYQAGPNCLIDTKSSVPGLLDIAYSAGPFFYLTNVEIVLEGAAAAVATATGALSVAVPLAGSAQAVATATGTLSVAVPLAGDAAGVAAATGSLDIAVPLAGDALAEATATGDMVPAFYSSGAATAEASASGTLSVSVGLEGHAEAQASAQLVSAPNRTGQLGLNVAYLAGPFAEVFTASAEGINLDFTRQASPFTFIAQSPITAYLLVASLGIDILMSDDNNTVQPDVFVSV